MAQRKRGIDKERGRERDNWKIKKKEEVRKRECVCVFEMYLFMTKK